MGTNEDSRNSPQESYSLSSTPNTWCVDPLCVEEHRAMLGKLLLKISKNNVQQYILLQISLTVTSEPQTLLSLNRYLRCKFLEISQLWICGFGQLTLHWKPAPVPPTPTITSPTNSPVRPPFFRSGNNIAGRGEMNPQYVPNL